MSNLGSILLLASLSLTLACFITNCPPGGKRSAMDMIGGRQRQCMSCGPERSGRCVGPETCCGPFGCLMKTQESEICRLEILNPHLCRLPGRSCNSSPGGTCVSDGICCSGESCSMDKSCREPRLIESPDMETRMDMIL